MTMKDRRERLEATKTGFEGQPGWVSGAPDLVERQGEQLRQDAARERLHVRGLEGVHVDRKRALVELTEEQRALRSSRPTSRRWRALARLDDEVDKLQQRHAEAVARLVEAEEVLRRAPEDDAATLAAWIAAGERGSRPEATIYERIRERDAAQLRVQALHLQVDGALGQRVEHVEKHREKMIGDARRDVEEARDRLLAHVRGLTGLRQALSDARATLEWTVSFPIPVQSFGFPGELALGLREPVERTLQTAARVQYAAVLSALEEDAAALAGRFARETMERLGTAEPATPLTEAMWSEDPRHKEWARGELERARALAEFGNVDRISEEARDLRPNPEAG